MGRIALRDYLNQIVDLIDESRLDEAVAHCRNILEQHPRHVETYQLLGRALLELQIYGDAADLFKRVLSADPESVISHAGLAITYSESGDLRRAIWHMERAFDIDPYNRAILVELSELYARRDDHVPEQIDVTRAALARLYLRGALYSLAADEFSTLLSENPDRIDLQLLLAETLYLDQKPKNAARLALKIVDQLPLCIKANAILAGVWFSSGRPDQAQQHLMRVRSLTLPQIADLGEDTLVAQVLSQADQKQLLKQVLIEEIDYVPVAGAGYSDETEWSGAGESEAAESPEMPDWLKEFSQSLDANKRKQTGSLDSHTSYEQQEPLGKAPADDPIDPDNEDNYFGPQDIFPGEDDPLFRSITEDTAMDPPGTDSGGISFQALTNLPDGAGFRSEFLPAQTMAAAVLAETSRQDQGFQVNVAVQEEEIPAFLQEEAMISNYPIEEDDATADGAEKSLEEDLAAEILSDSVATEWMDEISEDPAEVIDPPDWLYDAVGLSSQSNNVTSGNEAKIVEDISQMGSETFEKSEGAILPDWLGESVGIVKGQHNADGDTNFSDEEIQIDIPVTSVSVDEDDSTPVSMMGDFADQQGGAKKSTEDAMNGALEDPGFSQDDERDDLDGELKWLEELAASQDASDDAFSGAGSDFDSLGALPEEDFIPDWLKADVLDEATRREPSSVYASQQVGVEAPNLPQEGQTVPSQDVPDWLVEQMADETLSQEEDKSADIDWFNQIIAGDESAIDELLEVQTMSLTAESESQVVDTTEEQPSWLRELEKLDTAGNVSLESDSVQDEVISSSLEPETAKWQPIESIEAADEVGSPTPDDVPSDPEEAMAWLEQLALEQGLTGEELTEEVSDLVPDEFMEAALEIDRVGEHDLGSDLPTDVPDDPDEAMDWLERLAAEHGASEDELTTFIGDDDGATADMSTLEEPDDELESALLELEDVEMPADNGEALFWLEELVVGTDMEQAVDGMAEAEQVGQSGEPVLVIESEEVFRVEESPIDLEAAQIAAMITEAADVLEEDSETDADMESFDESIDETLIIEAISQEEGDVEIVDDVDDVESEVVDEFVIEEFEADPEVEDEVVVDDEVEVEQDVDNESFMEEIESETEVEDESLIEVVESEPGVVVDEEDDDLAWLDSLDEANVTGWLKAEEALLAEEQTAVTDLTPPRIDIDGGPEPEAVDDFAIPDRISEEHHYEDHGVPELSAAQAALQSGQITEALRAYSVLVDSGESLPYVIADLEGAVEMHPDQPGFMKLLGDAYSRNGQLQKAIEIYRLALNEL